MDKCKPDMYNVEYFIKRKLGDMFYKIPSVSSGYGSTDDEISVEINMSPDDYASCLLSGTTIKRWIKEEFDLTGYKIRATSYRHPVLTQGYTEYTINITKVGDE